VGEGLACFPNSRRVICFVGIDGSGKTTQAMKTLSYMRNRKNKCSYVWFGEPYLFSYPFMVACRILGFTRSISLQNGSDFIEHQYYRNKVIAFLWPWVQLIDLIILVSLRVVLPVSFGFTVVCDRFVHDALVGVMADTKDGNLPKRLVGRLILRIVPRGSAVFLLDTDVRVAYRRRLDVPNLAYLIVRRKYYRFIAECSGVSLIDVNGPFFVSLKQGIDLRPTSLVFL